MKLISELFIRSLFASTGVKNLEFFLYFDYYGFAFLKSYIEFSGNIPSVFIGAPAFALGAVLSLTSRGADLIGNKLIGYSNSHPTSLFARISMVVSNLIKIPGYYGLGVGVICTFVGTFFLVDAAFDNTRYSKSKYVDVAAVALGLVAGLGALWVGLPNITPVQSLPHN